MLYESCIITRYIVKRKLVLFKVDLYIDRSVLLQQCLLWGAAVFTKAVLPILFRLVTDSQYVGKYDSTIIIAICDIRGSLVYGLGTIVNKCSTPNIFGYTCRKIA